MEETDSTTLTDGSADSVVGTDPLAFTQEEEGRLREAAEAFLAGHLAGSVAWIKTTFHGFPVTVGTITGQFDPESTDYLMKPIFIFVDDEALDGLAPPEGADLIHGPDEQEADDTD